MDEFLQRRPVLAVMAVVLAFAVWVSVTNQTDPMVDRSFARLTVHIAGGPAGRVEISPKAVRVTVEGPQSVIRTLEARSIRVEAPIGAASAATRRVALQIQAPSGVGVVAISPRRVSVVESP